MGNYEDLRHLFSLIYIIPTFILYFIILYVIFFSPVKQKFSSSFYWLFGFSAINYIIHTISYYIVYRFNSIPYFYSFQETWPKESILYPIIYTLTYYSAFGIHTYSLALSFNRFTIFIFKTNYNHFWNKYLKYILCLCLIIPLILVWNFPFIGINHGLKIGNVLWISPSITTFASWWNRSRNLFYEISFTSITSLLMNLYVVFSIIKLRYYTATESKQISRQDSAMLFYSMLVFLTELYSCIQQYLLEYNSALFLNYVLSTQFIIADISTLSPAWFVLFINKDLRKEIVNLFVHSKHKNVVVVTGTLMPRTTVIKI